MPLDYEYGYTIEPPKPLTQEESQWQQMYQQFLENGIDTSKYEPGDISRYSPPPYEPPARPADPITVDPGVDPGPDRDELIDNDNIRDPASEQQDPNNNMDLPDLIDEYGELVDRGHGDIDRGGAGGRNDYGPYDYDVPAWAAPFGGMSNAVLDALVNAVGQEKGLWAKLKDWKTWASLLIPGGTTSRAIAEKWLKSEQNRRAVERLKANASPEWWRDPETGEIDMEAYNDFRRAANWDVLKAITDYISGTLDPTGSSNDDTQIPYRPGEGPSESNEAPVREAPPETFTGRGIIGSPFAVGSNGTVAYDRTGQIGAFAGHGGGGNTSKWMIEYMTKKAK